MISMKPNTLSKSLCVCAGLICVVWSWIWYIVGDLWCISMDVHACLNLCNLVKMDVH
jgi:hypothetical protein